MTKPRNLFKKFTSLEHLFQSWDHFKRGKRKKKDIQSFERSLEDHIFQLQYDLATLQYKHGPYDQFYVSEPKQRLISKAVVRDRLVHEAVHSILSEIFDRFFIYHSLSSREGKGTHFGIKCLQSMVRKVSANSNQTCYGLKMDIKRFFDTVDHRILKTLIRKHIDEGNFLVIIDRIIDSFQMAEGLGIPLGNVTSQLFANIYLHELDNFIKQSLKEKFYLRYCDDFLILSKSRLHLNSLIDPIQKFLREKLHLELHPKKVTVRKLSQGIDFVGYVLFQKHTLLRPKTRRRMQQRLKEANQLYTESKIKAKSLDQKIQSYVGILSHANQYALTCAIKNAYWVRDEAF